MHLNYQITPGERYIQEYCIDITKSWKCIVTSESIISCVTSLCTPGHLIPPADVTRDPPQSRTAQVTTLNPAETLLRSLNGRNCGMLP